MSVNNVIRYLTSLSSMVLELTSRAIPYGTIVAPKTFFFMLDYFVIVLLLLYFIQ